MKERKPKPLNKAVVDSTLAVLYFKELSQDVVNAAALFSIHRKQGRVDHNALEKAKNKLREQFNLELNEIN